MIVSLNTSVTPSRPYLAIGTNDGVVFWDGVGSTNTNATVSRLALNAPPTNRFRQIAMGSDSALWCVNGSGNGNANVNNNGPASGVYRLKNNTWRNFDRSNTPTMLANSQHSIYAAPRGSFHAGVWASSWGSAVTRFETNQTSDSVRTSRFDDSSANLRGIGSAPMQRGFVVAGEAKVDSRTETLWIGNFTSDSISARDRTGRFFAFAKPASLVGCTYTNNILLTVDGSGTKWIASATNSLLWAFNERGTLDNPADDQWLCIQGQLGSASVSAFANDQQGDLWVGTQQGLYRIVNPFSVFSSDQRLVVDKTEDSKIGRLRVNAIVVDAQNNKWLATNSGVWVIGAGVDTVVAQFSTETTPLVSNNVLSLAIDENTGRAYFGTDNGLSSAQTLAVKPETNLSNLRCYPQPFVPAEDSELVIDGLAANAEVKVTMLDGTLVRTITANNSRTVIWDGRDVRSQLVQSGVYVISAFSPADGGITGAAKVIVIQR
jgi:hypothetical protein